MLGYSQLNRLMKVHSPLGPDVLLITGLQGTEGLNRLYRFELELLTLPLLDVPFEKILGQPVAVEVTLPNGVGRWFHGIVSRFSQTRRDDNFAHYRAEIVPRLWLWTKRSQSRIFQQKTVPEILAEVLDGLDLSLELTGTYQPRDYCVQYRESDFAIASRLMEEEGICYFFEHSAEGHKMVLCDNPQQLPELPAPTSVVFDKVGEGVREDVRVQRWEKSQELCTTRHTLWDHCFELPGQNLEASQTIQETAQIGTVEHKLKVLEGTLEAYDYPGGYAQRFDGVDPGGGDRAADLPKIFEENKRTVQLRQEEETARGIRIEGQGNCAHFAPGYRFQLARHFNADGPYLITSVEHVARLNAAFRSGEEGGEMEYRNTFTCLPESIAYRPPRVTPKPVIAGVQTATVVGPEGQNVFVDKYGRVKVQFHWDRQGKHDADSSCWIRVGQSWAGQRWGAFFWPRIGHEVIVTFAEGDPDQPVITGSVYNAANMPPFALPDNAPAGGFKSCSMGGDPADKYNALVFYDEPDDEHVHIHSQTHEVMTSEASKFRRTPGPEIHLIGALPLGLGSGGGGGGDFLEPAPGDAIAPRIDAPPGSGAGGGIIEWPVGFPGIFGAPWSEAVASVFPGSTSYVAGTRLSGTLFGDLITHVLAGCEVKVIVDPEGMIFDAIGGIGLKSAVAGGLISGSGGSNTLVYGPGTNFVYGGNRLTVTRGEALTYKDEVFWKQPIVMTLSALIVGTITAMDLCAYILGKPDKGQAKDSPEWAKWITTALPSRFLALLTVFESKNAKVQAGLQRAEETERITDIATRYARRATAAGTFAAQRAGRDAVQYSARRAERMVQDAERRVLSTARMMATAAANQTNKVFQCPYSIKATDISLISSAPTSDPIAATSVHISAVGGGAVAANGSVLIDANKEISLTAKGLDEVVGGTAVSISPAEASMTAGDLTSVEVQRGEAEGHVTIGNFVPGDITLTQGPLPVGAPEIKLSSEPPSIKLSVGEPEVGASIELSMEGITLQWGLWKLTINELGISMSVAENSLKVSEVAINAASAESEWCLSPAAWEVTSPIVELTAETAYNCLGGTVTMTGEELTSIESPMVMIN